VRTAALLLAAVLALAGCGADPADGTRTLTVSAAASLTDVFGELERRFQAAHPGVDVVLNLGSSSELASQIANGAPADVFASASTVQMDELVASGLVDGAPEVFATNVLQIAVAPGNPAGVQGFADLARPGLAVVVCAAQVPCGAAAQRLQAVTGVTLAPVSEEPDVRSVLAKVTSGNADAGLVYVTDARSAGDRADGVDIAEAGAATTTYPIATLAGAAHPELAREFVELVGGPQGRAVLAAAGFGSP
jgi:molybdate transport system substrate-binding protein